MRTQQTIIIISTEESLSPPISNRLIIAITHLLNLYKNPKILKGRILSDKLAVLEEEFLKNWLKSMKCLKLLIVLAMKNLLVLHDKNLDNLINRITPLKIVELNYRRYKDQWSEKRTQNLRV